MSAAIMEIEEFDSKEEKWFSYYLSELKQRGLIQRWEYQPETFILSDEYKQHVFVEKKNHNQITDVKLLNPHSYTPDFKIVWDKSAHGKLYWQQGGAYKQGAAKYSKPRRDAFIPFVAYHIGTDEICTLVDVKGTFGASDRAFSITQKWMATRGMFVQKVVVSLCEKGIFYKSFFPRIVVAEEVYKRDGKRGSNEWKAGDSKIKVEVKLIEHWLRDDQR